MSRFSNKDATVVDCVSPWLSILIPVYNVKAYLEECVDSVMSQVDKDVEVILIDDRSTDGSFELMQILAQRWPDRLLLLQQPVNCGLSAARNTMINVAQGKYLWFLDSDDMLQPGAISELRDTIKAHAPDVVLCDFRVYRESPKLKHRLRGEHHKRTFSGLPHLLMQDRAYLLAGLLNTGQLHAWSKISRRSLWGPHIRFPEGKYFEDMLPTLLMASEADSFFYQPSPWVAYRQRSSSILGDMNLQKVRDMSAALLPLRDLLASKPWAENPALEFAWAHQCARNLTGAMRFLAKQGDHNISSQEASSLASHFRADFEGASPLSAHQLPRAYLRRGWFRRFLKFRRWFGYKQAGD